MNSFNKTVLAFNSLLSQQKYIEALQFYDSAILSTDNLNLPVTGIEALQQKSEEFIRKARIDVVEVVSLVMENNLSVTNWYLAFEHPETGTFNGHRFSVQRWKNDKIIQENHFYDE